MTELQSETDADTAERRRAASGPWTRDQLRARLDAMARIRLAHLPTPLEPCPRLSAAIGGPDIYVKRDDLTGLAFGGNKTRQLEFLFADLLAQGADTVVAGAYSQSNWCRQITAAACKLGLRTELVLLHGEKGPALQGNLLLDRVMGADVTITEIADLHELPPLLEARAASLAAEGRRPFLVNPFDLETLARSTLGYVNAALELDEQLTAAGVDPSHVYVCGANMTPAGLHLGLRALGRKARVVAITPIEWEEDRPTDIARIASATARLLGLDLGFTADDIHCDSGYIGERYGVVTPEGRAAFLLAARTEALILDPVYTSKALAGLIDHVGSGRVAADEPVVFVHTGGNPAVFAYAEDLLPDEELGGHPR